MHHVSACSSMACAIGRLEARFRVFACVIDDFSCNAGSCTPTEGVLAARFTCLGAGVERKRVLSHVLNNGGSRHVVAQRDHS